MVVIDAVGFELVDPSFGEAHAACPKNNNLKVRNSQPEGRSGVTLWLHLDGKPAELGVNAEK